MAQDDAWMQRAACRRIPDPDVFFPPKQKGRKTDYRRAKAICATCEVRKVCLTYAIAHGLSEGVWGGFSDTERRAIPRDMKVQIRRAWRRIYGPVRPQAMEGGEHA